MNGQLTPISQMKDARKRGHTFLGLHLTPTSWCRDMRRCCEKGDELFVRWHEEGNLAAFGEEKEKVLRRI